MKRFSRIAILLVLIGAYAALAVLPALATEGTEEPTSTTVAEEGPAPTSDIEPAVPVTTPSQTEDLPDWTYRYMIPTGIVLAVLVIMVTAVQYFTRVVRRRYRIVKE
ncbi:MAG TPA: hypothetical protein VLA91_15540 [Acidimicrobiia bacterium]|nr:hypothetical protein [Acidimicrobiia bacterium]